MFHLECIKKNWIIHAYHSDTSYSPSDFFKIIERFYELLIIQDVTVPLARELCQDVNVVQTNLKPKICLEGMLYGTNLMKIMLTVCIYQEVLQFDEHSVQPGFLRIRIYSWFRNEVTASWHPPDWTRWKRITAHSRIILHLLRLVDRLLRSQCV